METVFRYFRSFSVLSGISPQIFSVGAAFGRGAIVILATLAAIVAGAVLTPLLLPLIPFRQFWLKGTVMGGLAGLLFLFAGRTDGQWD